MGDLLALDEGFKRLHRLRKLHHTVSKLHHWRAIVSQTRRQLSGVPRVIRDRSNIKGGEILSEVSFNLLKVGDCALGLSDQPFGCPP